MSVVPIQVLIATTEGAVSLQAMLPIPEPHPRSYPIEEYTTAELAEELHRRLATTGERAE